MAEKQFYPMMPERSWWTLRQQFKKTIPTALSVSYLKSLLGLTSDQSARNLLSPLKQMKIIDDEGKPLPRANDWRNDDKYSIVCQEILKDIYPSELLDLFPEKDVDASSVKNWFMDVCAIGASAAGKNATTFVMLKSGNIKDFSNIKTSTTKIAKPKTTLIQKSNNAITNKISTPTHVSSNTTQQTPTSPIPCSKNEVVPTVHIDLQIHISPEASNAQIDAIFASMAKHLYGKGRFI